MQKSGNLLTDRRSLITLFTILTLITIDRLTKAWIRTYPELHVVWKAGFLQIIHLQNTGAAFGIFQGQNGPLIIVVCAGIVLMLALAFWVYRRLPYLVTKWNLVALGLILGGTTGNLIDRLAFGTVTDFLDTRFWPSFNAADSGITIGAVMLAITFLRLAWKEKR